MDTLLEQKTEENKKEEKKPRPSVAIKPELFIKPKALRQLYNETLKIDLTNADINVEHSMKKLISLVQLWQFELAPKYSFEYFLQRCSVLGNHKIVQNQMRKIRRVHQGIDNWDDAELQHSESIAEAMNILGDNPSENREEEDDYRELMLKMEAKALQTAKMENTSKKLEPISNISDSEENPYVPEGFEEEYLDDD